MNECGQTDHSGQVAAGVLRSPRGVADDLEGLEAELGAETEERGENAARRLSMRTDGRRGEQATEAEPLLGPRVLTSLPSISKPSVGRVPRGRAGLSPTCWQSTVTETLTWLTDRWT